MKSVFAMLVSGIVALCAPSAGAQPFLEFHVEGVTTIPGSGVVEPFGFKLVFDASLPPSSILFGSEFDSVYGEVFDTSANSNDAPVFAGEPTETAFTSGSMTYDPLDDSLFLSAGPGSASDFDQMNIRGLLGDFSDVESSLPDDPGAYLIDVTSPVASMDYFTGSIDELNWVPAGGFFSRNQTLTGSFTVRVRIVEDPNAPEPCLADINNDGFIDFFDISAYLQLYSDGCP